MKAAVKKLVQRSGPLAENEVKDLLSLYGIETTKYKVITHRDDVQNLSLTFPVALKVCSPNILHKTDVGGVKLNIQTMNELEHHINDFFQRFPGERLLVDQMEKKSIEMIVGLVQDPTFGLTLMCGVGGIFTELYEDVSFRVVPIEMYDAEEMINEIKGIKLFEGFRNIKVNRKIFIDLLLKISDLGHELMNHIDQMDLNPVFVYEDHLCVVDAKLIIR
jgi:acyl-CoA synthetase (NDP forming)